MHRPPALPCPISLARLFAVPLPSRRSSQPLPPLGTPPQVGLGAGLGPALRARVSVADTTLRDSSLVLLLRYRVTPGVCTCTCPAFSPVLPGIHDAVALPVIGSVCPGVSLPPRRVRGRVVGRDQLTVVALVCVGGGGSLLSRLSTSARLHPAWGSPCPCPAKYRCPCLCSSSSPSPCCRALVTALGVSPPSPRICIAVLRPLASLLLALDVYNHRLSTLVSGTTSSGGGCGCAGAHSHACMPTVPLLPRYSPSPSLTCDKHRHRTLP